MRQRRTEIIASLEKKYEEALKETDRLQDVLTRLTYEGKFRLGRNLNEARRLLQFFSGELVNHMQIEEKVLFPFLKTHVPRLESVICLLRSEHEDFRRSFGDFKTLLGKLSSKCNGTNRAKLIGKIKETGTYLIYLLKNHSQLENKSIYQAIDQVLHAEEKREIEKQIKRYSQRKTRK